MKQKLMLGMETIAFQSGLFFGELTQVCQEIKDMVNVPKPDKDEIVNTFQRLAVVIKHYTNLNARIEINDWGPAVIVPDLLKNHVLHDIETRDYISGGQALSAIASKGGPLKGTVSLKDSRVTGFFAEIEFPIYMPIWIFQNELDITAAEAASTLVHEVGHAFTYMEYLNRSVTTNVILNIMSRKWLTSSVQEREVVLINAAQALKIKNGDVDMAELATSSKFEIVETVITTAMLEQTRSELGGSEYEIVNFEYLSDEFAARHGAGRDIVTVLDKLHRMDLSSMEYRSLGKYMAMELGKLLFMLHPALWIITVIMIAMDHEYADNVYDKAPDRFRRVRGQLVERLKTKNLPKEVRDQLLQDISVIDDVISKLNDRRQLYTLLVERVMVWSTTSKRRKQLVLQRELEALALNNLFIKSAELDSLNKE